MSQLIASGLCLVEKDWKIVINLEESWEQKTGSLGKQNQRNKRSKTRKIFDKKKKNYQ